MRAMLKSVNGRRAVSQFVLVSAAPFTEQVEPKDKERYAEADSYQSP